MNSLGTHRRLRKNLPALENLDQRITPSTMPAAAALAAELRVETRQVGHWEAALANSHTETRDQILTNRINRTEGRMANQEARLARIDAGAMARIQAGNLGLAAATSAANQISSDQQVLSSTPTSNQPPFHGIIVTAPVTIGFGFSSATTSSSSQQPSVSSMPFSGNQPPFHGIIVTAPVTIGFGFPSANTPPASQSAGTTTNTASQATLPANVSATLGVIYDAYLQNGSSPPATIPATDGANMVVVQGSNVGIQVQDSNPANFNTLVSALQSAGMQITLSSAQYGTVVGLLPIAQLPNVGALPDAPSVTPLFLPAMA
jgi:hypothetical protein